MVHELPDGFFGALCDHCLVPAPRLPPPRVYAETRLLRMDWSRDGTLWRCARCVRRGRGVARPPLPRPPWSWLAAKSTR